METMDVFNVKMCWGNLGFDYVHSDSVGNSGGILCIWDPYSFRKTSSTVSNYFVIIQGVWLKTGNNLLIVSVYAPHDMKEKHMLWDYLTHVIHSWNGEVVIMDDFNEVRYKSDRFGSVFNVHGANAFNSFIANAGLEEVPLGGSSFTWCHKSATKMSKLDRFLIYENLLITCPNITAITLERYLLDHRPILLCESRFDYGPSPFCFYHYWLEMDGFNNFVEDMWSVSPGNNSNPLCSMAMNLKFLKLKIKEWNQRNIKDLKSGKAKLKEVLEALDADIDKGNGTADMVTKRSEVVNSLQEIDKIQTMEIAQKAKIKWCIEGDENSSKIPDANLVKDFRPISLIGSMYKIIAKIMANRPVGVLGDIVNEVQSSFIAERQILDGPFILNEVLQWCKLKKKQSLIFKVDFEKAFDSIRWDFLDDILKKISFGDKWCNWIQSCLRLSRGSIIINGSPT
ncbi:RNA-directed DNA polymerase, eukaryota [Tanacetum coccineum]